MRDLNKIEGLLGLLVKFGADLEAKTPLGHTFLMKILSGWQYQSPLTAIQTLLNAGACIEAQDYYGRNVLHLLCQDAQSSPLIRALINGVTNPLVAISAGDTLLHYVARKSGDYYFNELENLLETTVELGVGPSSKNHLGQIPLHMSAGTREQHHTSYKTDPLDFLLGPKCNSDVNAADNKGVRPIHLAATLCEKRVRRLFMEGADANELTVESQSLLHVVSRARQSNIVALVTDLYVSKDQSG